MSITEIERDVINWNAVAGLPEFAERFDSFKTTLINVSEREGGESAVKVSDIHPYTLGFLVAHGYVAIDRYGYETGPMGESTLMLTRSGENVCSAYGTPTGLKVLPINA